MSLSDTTSTTRSRSLSALSALTFSSSPSSPDLTLDTPFPGISFVPDTSGIGYPWTRSVGKARQEVGNDDLLLVQGELRTGVGSSSRSMRGERSDRSSPSTKEVSLRPSPDPSALFGSSSRSKSSRSSLFGMNPQRATSDRTVLLTSEPKNTEDSNRGKSRSKGFMNQVLKRGKSEQAPSNVWVKGKRADERVKREGKSDLQAHEDRSRCDVRDDISSPTSPIPETAIIPPTLPTAPPLLTLSNLSPCCSSTPPHPESPFHRLPTELKLVIFQNLISLHVDEHAQDLLYGRFRGEKARSRWVGRTAGLRELIKFGRVCKEWNELTMNGELWDRFELSEFGSNLLPSRVIEIVRRTGGFMRVLECRSLPSGPSGGVMELFSEEFNRTEEDDERGKKTALELNGLERLDIQNVPSFPLSPGSFGDALILSSNSNSFSFPSSLKWLSLKSAGNSQSRSTLVLLDLLRALPRLEYLDLSFTRLPILLPNNPHSGVSPPSSSSSSSLREFRAAGVGTDEMIRWVLRLAAGLEVVDLSYSPPEGLTDRAFDWVDPVEGGEEWVRLEASLGEGGVLAVHGAEYRFLTAEESGRDGTGAGMGRGINGTGLYPRRLTRLRKLVISNTPSMTSRVLARLTHAVPRLEVFEWADSDGCREREDSDRALVGFLKSARGLRKVDLEGCMEITDEVLEVWIPQGAGQGRSGTGGKGGKLEVLNIGFAGDITMDALRRLIHGCPHLRELYLDNTNTTDLIVKEFIRRRGGKQAIISVIDCPRVSRNVVEVLQDRTRARNGFRGWRAAPLGYRDGRWGRGSRDECGERPVLQSFWTWSGVARVDGGEVERGSGVESRVAGVAGDVRSSKKRCVIM